MFALVAAFLFPALARADTPLSIPKELAGYASDVPTATAYRYNVRDDQGNPMIGLKVISNPQGGYLGVYHSGNPAVVRVAKSTDLLNWTRMADLAGGLNPTLARLDLPSYPAYDKSFVLAYEIPCWSAGQSCLVFLFYADLDALFRNAFSRSFIAPRTLSSCIEGTPNITGASVDTAGKLVLNAGFHYSRDCLVFRQANGTLVDFSSWTTQADTNVNNLFEALSPPITNVRDRDLERFRGSNFKLYDAQLTLSDPWRPWLYDFQGNALSGLTVRTHGGSTSFGLPTMTDLQNADGSRRLIVTYYVDSPGAASGEAGELLFYRDYDVPTPPPRNVQDELTDFVTDVPGATAYRYGLRDSRGVPMTNLKVEPNPQGGYVGVYQRVVGTTTYVELATSTDLSTWTFVRDLAANGTNPNLTGWGASFFVAYQKTAGCTGLGTTPDGCLRIELYPDLTALLSGSPTRSFDPPRTLSSCQEGTPAIWSVRFDPQGKMILNISFHYSRDCSVMRQATGKLVDFSTWTAQPDTALNNLFETATPTVGGNVRDRDFRRFRGLSFNLHEAQLALGTPSSWRAWLYNWQTAGLSKLDVRTQGGSTSFNYPTITNTTKPDGTGRLIVTYNVNAYGAAPGEAGELLFYRDYQPTIAAAGDISGTTIAGQKRASDLIVANPPTAVLALGDNQYDNGELSNFMSYYDPTWGRFKTTTYPTPGNHDKCPDSGYDEYYGSRAPGCWYSFDIGQWHFISLDANHPTTNTAQLAFLEQDLASTTKKCVAAFWHQPRFSSGTHGDNTGVGAFWTRLYAAGADLVLNGHDHDYERFAPQDPTGALDYARGIREFVVGTGGRSTTSISTPKPNSEARNWGNYGVLRLTLGKTGYAWRYESEAGKTFTDSGTGDCH